jgi:hypothetical protein
MKMVRTPTSLSPNRSLVVLFALLMGLVAISAGRMVLGGSFQPSAPFSVPVENPASPLDNPAPIVPAVEASSLPMPATEDSGVRTTETTAPAPASLRPAAPTAAPAATAVPRGIVPPGPATSAAPGRDIHAIAPEPGMPGFIPPPGRE